MKTTQRPKRSRDVNQLAALTLALATGEASEQESDKQEVAISLGRKGGLKGGKARSESMTAEQRQAVATLAAEVKWEKKAPSENTGASNDR